jgi:hypothetical protein
MRYVLTRGRFLTIEGHRVIQRFPRGAPATTFYPGRPHGIMFHYTAGCQADLTGLYRTNGYGGANFCVARDGTIYQFFSLDVAGWHAYTASHEYLGIEHAALPGTCELTDPQLEASAMLSAAVIAVMRKRGIRIPLRKMNRAEAARLAPGFLQHHDGPTCAGCWNRDGHTCHLYRWTWDHYLGRVRSHLTAKEDPLASPDVKDQIAALHDELAGKRDGFQAPPGSAPDPKKAKASTAYAVGFAEGQALKAR